jgi:23S rRNA (pseudouridine1915-N3)-methyltransferase
MRFELVVVGKLREKWLQKGAEEYIKRLGRLAKLKITEIADQPCPKAEAEQVLAVIKEGEQLLTKINSRSFVVVLDVKGKTLDSPGLAGLISSLSLQGISDMTMVIGGSMGLSEYVMERADLRLSFSAFTFPHQLMRVIVLEQIYRACKINAGETYHK